MVRQLGEEVNVRSDCFEKEGWKGSRGDELRRGKTLWR